MKSHNARRAFLHAGLEGSEWRVGALCICKVFLHIQNIYGGSPTVGDLPLPFQKKNSLSTITSWKSSSHLVF